MDIKPIFKERLKARRKELKISQQTLAEKSGANQSQISAFEHGDSTPNLEIAVSIAKELDISLDKLCGLDADSKEITPFQWLVFTDKLLSNPPKIEHKPTVELSASNAALSFHGEIMEQFLKAYDAIRSIRDQLPPEMYQQTLYSVLHNYSQYFEPGFQRFTKGATVPPSHL